MNSALLSECVLMDPDKQPPTLTARIATELIDQAHVICAHAKGTNNRPVKMIALLDSILRPTITAMHDEVIARIAKTPSSKISLDELLEVAARRLNQLQSHRPKSRKPAE